MQQLQARLKSFVVIPYDEQVVNIWAQMHAKLSGHLHKGGTNDLWTAACALSLNPQLPIVTNNLNDFQTIAAEFNSLVVINPRL
jgi:predicted nucleic acid-binding protein